MPSFKNEANAFANLIMPTGHLLDEANSLLIELEEDNPELTILAGPCDLCMRFAMTSFRRAFSINTAFGKHANLCNWVFSVPYESHSAPIECPSFRFILYLRVDRGIYCSSGLEAEEFILDQISSILSRPQQKDRVSISAHAGIGWADIVLYGETNSTKLDEDITPLIFEIRGLRLNGQGVFQRSLTLLGYPWPTVSKKELPLNPIVRIRALAGRLRSCYTETKNLFGDDFVIKIAEGKWDITLVPKSPDSKVPNFHIGRKYNKKIRDLVNSGDVERIQSQLLVVHEGGNSIDLLDDVTGAAGECACSEVDFEGERAIDALALRDVQLAEIQPGILAPIPAGLQDTIKSVYSLFRYALRDPNNCCDIFATLGACDRALLNILKYYRKGLDSYSKAGSQSAKERGYTWLLDIRKEMNSWCRDAELILAERTAGSFTELFTGVVSMASHRGSVQKYLYIADALMREFLESIRDATGLSIEPLPVALYGSSSIIENSRLTGFVTVPTRYLFALPLMIPQLWAEAAHRVFYSRYPVPFSEESDQRLREYRELGYNVNESSLLARLADHYSDMLLLRFGFQGDFSYFTLYLSTLVFNAPEFRDSPDQKIWLVELVERLIFTYEFAAILSGDFRVYKSEDLQGTLSVQLPKRRDQSRVRQEYLSLMASIVRRYLRQLIRGTGFSRIAALLSADVFDQVVENMLKRRFVAFEWEYMWDLVEIVRERDVGTGPKSDEFERLQASLKGGAVVDFSSEKSINSHYLEAYVSEAKRRLHGEESSPPLKYMSALAKSAHLAFLSRTE